MTDSRIVFDTNCLIDFVCFEACRDPKDNKFLELAITASAQYIISRDEDLLVLHPFRSITICTPKAFIETYRTDGY